ncbi:allantoinase AllB [Corynebacterium heidelbergense]|uniref:allantoinase n=1 Tax=Corynebacterium heidelbergense TaxID=2055947 RepID=A0A364V4I3_9CORY|nr:allantoinase AllB [Corynebacterium heidelbergense]RAV31528.1 allantoinase AllB [Corynebacterium heidelbergense]
MPASTTVFRAHSAVYEDPATGRTVTGPAEIFVSDGMITQIRPKSGGASPEVDRQEEAPADSALAEQVPPAQTVDVPPTHVLIPGLVDTHVHVNEPGRTEWEGFETVTRAAAAGGVTTLLDMPLNSIPSTTSLEALATKREIAAQKAKITVGFWGGAVPENVGTGELRALWETGRVFGFKCFLLHSGVDEFAPLNRDQLYTAMREIAEFDGLLIVHAEDPGVINEAEQAQQEAGGITEVYRTFELSRPDSAETAAIRTVIEAAEATGCRAHILHLSSAQSLPIIRDAKNRGVRITAETCPHYLSLFSEEIHNGATQFKCCPPIRSAENREELWKGLVDGVIDMVVTDHSPCTAELKKFAAAARNMRDHAFSALATSGNDLGGEGADGRGAQGSFGDAWGGVASVQLGLPVVWSQARRRGLDLSSVVDWMCTKPARWAGLPDRGAIRVGARADFAAIAADDAFVVLPERLYHRNKVTAYAQQALAGLVTHTWIGGSLVYRRPQIADDRSDANVFPHPIVPLLSRPEGE